MQPRCVELASPESLKDDSARRLLAEQLLAEIVGKTQFEHWFRQSAVLNCSEDELIISVTNPFLLQWLKRQFREALARAAHSAIGPAARVRFEVAPAVTQSIPAAPPIALQSALASAPASAEPAKPVEAARPTGRRFADLADFIPGPCNAMALAAVRQVCTRSTDESGPLYLYGSVGTGKTHLLEGTYRELRSRYPGWNVMLLTSEQFTNYFTQALRERMLPAFRARFRTVDALLVDDVDFLDAKRGVQEEFLHTFQQLETHGRLAVVCADRHPRLLSKVCDDLKTRFLAGMVCRIEPPCLETREKIVIRKAARLEAEFSPEALRYVARRFTGGVRELEGALNCLAVHYSIARSRISALTAQKVLSDLERDCLRAVRLADIERVVCDLFGVEPSRLRSASRERSVTEPRMLAMFLARRHTRAAYVEIGAYFGGRNHATVIAAERRVVDSLSHASTVRIASRVWNLADVLETLEHELLAG
jgi:chromosomal replication initiator protein